MKILIFLLFPFFAISQNPCGGEYRWKIKILIDSEAKVFLNTKWIMMSSVDKLVSTKRPPNDSLKNGRCEIEKTAVEVSGYIVAIGKEEDEDYHLVIKSDTSEKTLIAEIPDYKCDDLKDYYPIHRLKNIYERNNG